MNKSNIQNTEQMHENSKLDDNKKRKSINHRNQQTI